jgi:signal transduction histidine kinase
MVSHDMRGLLQTMSLSTGALLRVDTLDARVKQSLLRISQTAERATRMMRDLLDFTQMRLAGGIAVRLSAVDLERVVEDALDEVRTRFPERPVTCTRSGDVHGQWDGDRLVQVTVNLLTNALKYSPEGSPVEVSLRDDGAWVQLEVHNLGDPIAAEHVSRLFSPFERAGKVPGHAHGGLGLGLFIVAQLVRAHGGQVGVESTSDEGTTFRVRLPRRPFPRR